MTKKVPERRCVGCGESFPKKELIRVVRTPEGEIKIDATGKLNGRGAYVCKKTSCFKNARRKNRFSVNLDTRISDELLDSLEAQVAECEKEAAASDDDGE